MQAIMYMGSGCLFCHPPNTQSLHLVCTQAADSAGFSYWADWLDLQAKGPVPWRKEIAEGIRDCAKVVLFVDTEYLKSYNCMQARWPGGLNNMMFIPASGKNNLRTAA